MRAFSLPHNKAALAALYGAAMALSACGGMSSQESNVASVGAASAAAVAVLPASYVAELQATCAKAAPLLALAGSAVAPVALRSAADYPKAFCAPLMAAVPALPPTADAGSQRWLDGVLAVVMRAAQVAKMVAPML